MKISSQKPMYWETPWLLMILIVLSLAAYSFMLNGEFRNIDDRFSIVESPFIQDPANLLKIFSHGFFKDHSYYRPLVSVSFMLEYQLFGLNAFYYYLNNVFLHIGVAILVFLITRRIFEHQIMAFGVALLFVIHPIHWEPVGNIPGRSILLCAFFNLLSMWLFMLWRSRGKMGYVIASLVAFALSLLSKESAAMLPILLGAYVLMIDKKRDLPWAKVVGWLAPYFILIGVYLAIRHSLGITQMFRWPTWEGHLLGFLSFLRGTLTFFRLFIWPHDLHFDRARLVFFDFANAELWATVIVYLLGALALLTFRRRITPRVWYCLFWFYLGLFPVSQIVISIGTQPGYISIAEHFLYVPSIGIFCLIIMGLRWGYIHWPRNRWVTARLFHILVLGMYCGFYMVTIQNNIFASHELSMLERSIQFNPHNTRLLYSVGFFHADHRNFSEAEKYFRRVLELEPWNEMARIALGKCLIDQERFFESVQVYEQVVFPGNMQELYEKNKKLAYEWLIRDYQKRLPADSQNARLHYTIGVFYQKNRQLAQAAASYEAALAIDARFKEAIYNLASCYEQLAQFSSAKGWYERLLSLSLQRDDLDRQSLLALLRIARQQQDAAAESGILERLKEFPEGQLP